jgi:hypothetical protein
MIHLHRPARLPVASEVVPEGPALRILCGVCRDADSVRRWVIVDPLVDRSISYACKHCEPIEEGAVALILARSPHLLVTSGPVV